MTFHQTSAALSVIFIGSAFYSFYQLHSLELPDFLAQAGHYQFLTNIALCLTTIYAGINLIYHRFHYANLATTKLYLSALCLPLNFIVSLVYWSLKIFATDLILAKESAIEMSLDLRIHLFPIAFSSLDYFLFMDSWKISNREGYMIMSLFTISYWFWLEFLIKEDAMYPYPFLNVESKVRIIIFFFISTIAYSVFLLCKALHKNPVEIMAKKIN